MVLSPTPLLFCNVNPEMFENINCHKHLFVFKDYLQLPKRKKKTYMYNDIPPSCIFFFSWVNLTCCNVLSTTQHILVDILVKYHSQQIIQSSVLQILAYLFTNLLVDCTCLFCRWTECKL